MKSAFKNNNNNWQIQREQKRMDCLFAYDPSF